jgi:hypothetical protein
MPVSSHFAAMEEPELLAEDIRRWFRAFRSDPPRYFSGDTKTAGMKTE